MPISDADAEKIAARVAAKLAPDVQAARSVADSVAIADLKGFVDAKNDELASRIIAVIQEYSVGGDLPDDRLVAAIPNAENGFRLLFAATPFPGYTVDLKWRREEYGGNWYYSPKFDLEGWLCPALFKYFDKAPTDLYVRAEPK